MPELLDENTQSQVKEIFQNLEKPVSLVFFESKVDCQLCEQTKQLLFEVGALSDKVNTQILNFDQDTEKAACYGVKKAPMFFVGENRDDGVIDHGIHFMGIPAGHEFTSFISAILMVSTRKTQLKESTKLTLQDLSSPVDLQVFTTPTCPYCPQAVMSAHQMAMVSPLITASMVNSMEYQMEAKKLGVQGVPHTSINQGDGTLVGAEPEEALLDEIIKVATAKEKK